MSPFFLFSGSKHPRRSRAIMLITMFLALLLIVGSLLPWVRNLVRAAPSGGFAPLSGTVPALVAHSSLVGPDDPSQPLTLSLSLKLRNTDLLRQYLATINQPRSLNYHRYLSAAQVENAFSPTASAHAAALSYLRDAGFTITKVYQHRLLIDFSGTVGLAEQAFHIQINNYREANGKTFYANAANPQLPASLIGVVQGIAGLNDIVHWSHPPLPTASRNGKQQKSRIPENTSCPGPGSQYYTPTQMASAYNLDGLYNQGIHGEGQTVALFELSSYLPSDLSAYEACFGQSHTPVYPMLVDGGPLPPPPGGTDQGVIEVELDAEVVLSAAPGLGQLDIYEAPNTMQGYNDEWAQIIQNDPPVVSTSWGDCEDDLIQQEPGEVQQENQFFMVAAAQGESVFAASGDSGSTGCLNTSGSTILNAGDPASQPFVTGVGGTTLTINQDGSYGGEVVWNNGTGASGGGISEVWTENPNWLSVHGVQNQYSGGAACNAPQGSICREGPDVSLDADPYTGYPIYCTSPVAGCTPGAFEGYPWLIVGGTSAAAPMWAAMMALTNEKSLKSGGYNMGFVTPLLYVIAGNATKYQNDFHDITQGDNDFSNYQNGLYPATAGFDMATGLGSYNAANLASDLADVQGQRATTPAAALWYFAEGSVGGSFQEYLTLQNPSINQTASVTIKYLLQNHTPGVVTVNHSVPPSTRSTVNVNSDLGISPSAGHVSVAAIVSSNIDIVAERPMYFDFYGIKSGTDVLGATSPQETYYFPEADSSQNDTAEYSTFITMLNPSATQSATVTITYYTGTCGGNGPGACPVETKTLLPMTRGTASPLDVNLRQQIAISVTSTIPVVVERPMYVSAVIPNAGGETTGAASVVGATQQGTNWLFAEGYTGADFQEYLDLTNFGTTTVTATVNLDYTNGDVQATTVYVPALSITQFDVNAANANPGTCNPSPCEVTASVSAQVTSNLPLVVDRLMYFHYRGSLSGISEVVGTPTSSDVYSFAEGYTGGQFTTYVTLQNPTASSESVAVTLFTQRGLVLEVTVAMSPHSRSTLDINTILNPIGPDSVSMVVQALGTGSLVVAERPEYFNYGGDTGATDVIGYWTSGCQRCD
jgi:kumamolisin